MPNVANETPQQQDNLLALQNSARMIRNPFGFDFKTTWNSQEVKLPGDGNWYSFVGPLAAHVVKHLMQAVINKKHDIEVAKLRDAGQEKAARKFHLPEYFKNKVHVAITGYPDPKLGQDMGPDEYDIDFSELEKDMRTLEAEAAQAQYQVSAAPVQKAASEQAMAELGDIGAGQSGRVAGAVNMGGPVDPNAGALPTVGRPANPVPPTQQQQPISPQQPVQTAPAEPVVPQAPAQPQTPSTPAANQGEFPGLKELE